MEGGGMRTISPTGRNGALYNVHCRSVAIARTLRGAGNVSRVDMSAPMPNDAMFRFRCIPAYRSKAALELRQQVADILRSGRE